MTPVETPTGAPGAAPGAEPAAQPPAAPRRLGRKRRSRVTSVASALTATAAGVAALVAASVATAPLPAAAPADARALPRSPGRAVLVCPGAQADTSAAADGAGGARPGATALAALAVPEIPGTPGSGLRRVPLADVAAVLAADPPSSTPGPPLLAGALEGPAVVLGGRPDGSGTGVPTSAVQLTSGGTGPLRGLAARACQPAVSRAWLVGGATVPGHVTQVVLANPGERPAQVRLRVLGPAGAITLPEGDTITVPGGAAVTRALEEFAPALAATVLEVTAVTGRVASGLRDVVVRGVTAGGVEEVGPAATPRRVQVVPGLVVATAGDARPADDEDAEEGDPQGSGTDGDAPPREGLGDPGAVTVRIAVPGRRAATVRVRLLGPEGPLDLPGGTLAVPAGAVRDVPVRGVPDGTYAAVVESDAPVVAGAESGRTAPGGDLAGTADGYGRNVPPAEQSWSAGATELPSSPLVIAVPQGPRSRVALAAPGSAARLSYRLVGPDGVAGQAQDVDVAAGSSLDVDIPPSARGILVRASGRLVAALVVTDLDPSGPLQAVVPIVGQPTGGVTADTARPDPLLGIDEPPAS